MSWRWIQLIAMALLIWSCQKEELLSDPQITQAPIPPLSIQKVPYDQLPSYEWIKNKNEKGLNWELYTGEIAIYDIDGTIKAKGQFKNGKSIGYTSNKGMQGKSDEQDCVVTEVSVGGLEQNGEFYPTDIIIDYECSGGGGTSGDSDSGFPNGGGMLPHDGGETHGGGSSGGEGSSDDGQIPTLIDDRLIIYELFEEKIDDTTLKQCLKNILNKLKGQSNGVAESIKKFSGSTQGFNWEVKDGTLSGGTGQTSSKYNRATGTVSTIFDSQNWKQSTDLSWARTILHESIHAILVAEFNTNRPNWIASYPEMVAEWGRLQNWNAVHHEEFARSIVNDIASSLEEYGRIQGYNLSSQFYKAMAWGGLQSTSTFQGMSTSTKNRILNVISVELTGKDLNGNFKTQHGSNAGC